MGLHRDPDALPRGVRLVGTSASYACSSKRAMSFFAMIRVSTRRKTAFGSEGASLPARFFLRAHRATGVRSGEFFELDVRAPDGLWASAVVNDHFHTGGAPPWTAYRRRSRERTGSCEPSSCPPAPTLCACTTTSVDHPRGRRGCRRRAPSGARILAPGASRRARRFTERRP